MESVEHIRHKAVDWNNIADNLPKTQEESGFADYLLNKSTKACHSKGNDFVFGETVTQPQAKDIRSTAGKLNIKEQSSEAAQ